MKRTSSRSKKQEKQVPIYIQCFFTDPDSTSGLFLFCMDDCVDSKRLTKLKEICKESR